MVVSLVACLTCAAAVHAGRFVYTPEELDALLDARLALADRQHVTIPFEIDDDIRAWAHEVTADRTAGRDIAEALARAIVADDRLRTRYDESTTITAREVFRSGRANCISLTNLFIGAARELGLVAYYVDVTQAITVGRVQDVIVTRGHVCAGIWFQTGFVLYDFADRPERAYSKYAILSDVEAVATFVLARHLNLAFREEDPALVDELLALARRDTELALAVNPDFAKAYVNLGSAYLRFGQSAQAIALYRKALLIDSRLVAAHLAMGYVYARDGNYPEARMAFERARAALPSDPIVRYHLGVAQLRDGDPKAALRSLEAALALDPDLKEAWSGLGLAHRALGDEEEALRAFYRAGDAPPDTTARLPLLAE